MNHQKKPITQSQKLKIVIKKITLNKKKEYITALNTINIHE